MNAAKYFRPGATIDRGPYALIGLIGFAIKHNLDRIVGAVFFERGWGIFHYWDSPFNAATMGSLTAGDREFIGVMLALAVPFIAIGITLTLARLRSAGLPPGLVALFFLPFVNLLFFAVLSALPPTGGRQPPPRPFGPPDTWLDRVIPRGRMGSAALGVGVRGVLAVPALLFAIYVVEDYGWGLFVGLPFALGLASVLIYSHHEPRPLADCLIVAWAALGFVGLALLASALEGVICLVMALPIGGVMAAFGGIAGYAMQRCRPARTAPTQAFPAIVLALPLLMIGEHALGPEPVTLAVTTTVDIDAMPQAVWNNVVAFAEMPEPEEWIFRLGVAYPMRAEIFGSGRGAERHCVFSTGAFVEPIEVWDEPRLLRFSVTSNPPPMEEWTPYPAVHPPHLDGYLVSNGGQFLLEPLEDGRTRLSGTTWYRHSMWPEGYWKLWSDAVIHRIHLRVLRHIKGQAEG
jgi:hypothetical protein